MLTGWSEKDEGGGAVLDLKHISHFEEVEKLHSSLCSSPFCFQSIHAQSVIKGEGGKGRSNISKLTSLISIFNSVIFLHIQGNYQYEV